jgi:hypothetical protein
LIDKDLDIDFKMLFFRILESFPRENIFNCDESGLFWRENIQRNITLDKKELIVENFLNIELQYYFVLAIAEKNCLY